MAVTMIYNSPQFCVFEFEGAALAGDRDVGGEPLHELGRVGHDDQDADQGRDHQRGVRAR